VPTYDYRCAACGHELEEFQSMHEPALKKCPKCKKNKLERQIGSGAGILFKGGGFYQTDYRSESYKSGETSEKGDGKAPTAPEAKVEAKKPAEPAKPASKKKAGGSST
jgi:putative FmdB family regulatory protein